MNAYTLMITLRSPFARRARLAFLRLGIPFEKEELNVFEPTERFLQANPLGLAPVLLVNGGGDLTGLKVPDSAAILEFLHDHHGQKIWPMDPIERARTRSASTFAEGVMNATVGYFLETQREHPDQGWIDEHLANLHRTLGHAHEDKLDDAPWMNASGELTQAGFDLAVALEYAELRLPEFRAGAWKARYPKFAPLLEMCRAMSAFTETSPPPA